MIEISGIAHTCLTVSNFEVCRRFYKSLLPFLGMQLVFDGDKFCYHVGGKTGIGIQPCAAANAHERFVQDRVGLHHLCFRARSREDVDKVYSHLEHIGAKVIHPPEEGPWVPGYYSVLFEDPDGIRLEVNHVPGKGILEKGVSLDPTSGYQ